LCVEVLSLAIESAFKARNNKKDSLEELRVRIEILKHLIRTEYELRIIDERTYLRVEKQVVEISKMTNGWISFITQKEPSLF
jgi:hypothetical protein